jgi:hypothetical protein
MEKSDKVRLIYDLKPKQQLNLLRKAADKLWPDSNRAKDKAGWWVDEGCWLDAILMKPEEIRPCFFETDLICQLFGIGSMCRMTKQWP